MLSVDFALPFLWVRSSYFGKDSGVVAPQASETVCAPRVSTGSQVRIKVFSEGFCLAWKGLSPTVA